MTFIILVAIGITALYVFYTLYKEELVKKQEPLSAHIPNYVPDPPTPTPPVRTILQTSITMTYEEVQKRIGLETKIIGIQLAAPTWREPLGQQGTITFYLEREITDELTLP